MEPKAASFAGNALLCNHAKNKHTIISIEFKEILLPFESIRITSIDLCPNICNSKHLRVDRTLFGLELEQKQTITLQYTFRMPRVPNTVCSNKCQLRCSMPSQQCEFDDTRTFRRKSK